MISTASKTTASLSEAKNSKTGLLCHAGCSDEYEFAMRRSISSARTRVRSNQITVEAGVPAPQGQPEKPTPPTQRRSVGNQPIQRRHHLSQYRRPLAHY